MKIKFIIQEANQRIPLTRKNPVDDEDVDDPFEEDSMFGRGFEEFKQKAKQFDLSEMTRWLGADKRFLEIGNGAFRVAFEVLDSRVPVVLKLATQDFAIQMNLDEIDFFVEKNQKVFPKIHDADESGAWILVEKVEPFTEEKRMQLFPELANFNKEIKSNKLLIHLISTGKFARHFREQDIAKSSGEDFNLALLAANELIKRSKLENLKAGQIPRSLLTFMRRPVVMDFLRSYQEGGSSLVDLRDVNLGVNEQGELRMIDTGLGA